jgi:transposase
MASSINSRMVAIWQTRPLDLPPYSTVYWHYKQWRSQGVLEELMRVLHSQVRLPVKKNEVDYIDDDRFTGS